ncbi:MAG: terminase [Akkermansiaceae bacterium]|nr:terminase [Akkermansiaceae bacterium]
MNIQTLKRKALATLMPPPDLLPSEWADRYRRLSPESSAEPGRFEMDRTPYMREILDCIKEPEVETVWFTKSSQVAASETANNLVGYLADCDPCPIMVMQPTIEMTEDYSKDRVTPMFRDTPRLKGKIDDRKKKSGNTIRHKAFPGGLIQFVGANSAASLASRPIRALISDEVDRYPASAGKEGDPIKLARARQTTFIANRFHYATGTPTVKGYSRIEKGVQEGDMREYRVPCPRCGEHFALEFEQFQSDREKESYGQCCCPNCGDWIEEHERFEMIRDEKCGGTARWVPTKFAPASVRSYRIWAGYSPFKGWVEICDEWNEAKGDQELEKVFHNTVLGRSYAFSTADLDHEHLFRSREDYDGQSLPLGVEIITAGIDTQDNRFEIEIVAWGAGEESWSIEYLTIEGDPEKKTTRDQLDRLLADSVYRRTDGRELRIAAAFVDLGGHRTDAVYQFARGKAFRHIHASKGSNVPGQPIFARFSDQKKERVRIAIVGTDTAKEVIYSRLAKGSETSAPCHFPLSYSVEYFRGLTAEECIKKWKSGTPSVKWQKKKGEEAARNEPLDCRVYALAALRSLPMALRRLRRKEAAQAKAAKEQAPAPETQPITKAARVHDEVKPASRPAPKPSRDRGPFKRGGGWSI